MTSLLKPGSERVAVLDGWRAVSILLVLAAHLLPLGPKSWQLNATAGPMGMALFFTLSGFLITRFLLHHDSVIDFVIRRFFRIVPLAWTGLIVALPMAGTTSDIWIANFLFVANVLPMQLPDISSHYWSLNVEVQFYVAIALLFAVFGVRGLYVLPVLCLAITFNRVSAGTIIDITTQRRADEILAGCVLAMVVDGRFGWRFASWLRQLNPPFLMLALAICSHPGTGFMNYFRPYIAALLVGTTLYGGTPLLIRTLESRAFTYIAKISFSLYIIHHILMFTWVGLDNDKVVKYLKRPLLFGITFALAHWSTFYFEQRWIDLGKYLSSLWLARRAAGSRIK